MVKIKLIDDFEQEPGTGVFAGRHDLFYDKHLRQWTLLWKDEAGNQIEDAEYFPLKYLGQQAIEERLTRMGLAAPPVASQNSLGTPR